jgi:alpha-mannosidase
MNHPNQVTLPATRAAMNNSHARQEAAHERIRCQLQFGELLCKLHPDRASAWRLLLGEACRQVEVMAQSPNLDMDAAVEAAEAVLAPLAETAKSYHVYGIGHAHIDMNWQWSWQETVGVINDSFLTVLRLMEEFPEFHFTQSQAAIYRVLEQYHPELLARIADRVREGRWEVAASHWVEGDKNMAGGESLCRHLLYTRRYMQKLFGLSPEDVRVDWSPDTFGHAATVPTYLAQGGVKHCMLHRPGAHAEHWPQAFRWFGPDESSVLVFNAMKFGYNGVFCPRMILERIDSWFTETGLQFAPFIYGVGDHGGGPTRRDLLRFRELRDWPIFPSFRLTTSSAFFGELERSSSVLPQIRGELNFAFAGCYTSQSLLKKDNRQGENRLDDAERAAALAATVVDEPYAAGRLEQAWRNILFSQFHDILPGSCVHDSLTYSHGLFQESMAMATTEETKALRALAAAVDTRPTQEPTASGAVSAPAAALHAGFAGGAGHGTHSGGPSQADGGGLGEERPLVLFNLDQGERREVVEATIWENARDLDNLPFHRQAFAVSAPDGTISAAQIVEKGDYWGHDYVRLAFPARVPAFGYARYTVVEAAGALPAPAAGVTQLGREELPARYSYHDLTEEGLENQFFRVELDMRTGGIRRLLDKVSGRELITPANPASMLEFGVERPHLMNSWGVDHPHLMELPLCTGLRRKDKGPYLATIEVTFTIRASEFTLVYELRDGDPRLHLRLRGTWREFGSAQTGVPFLQLAVPVNLADPRLTSEIAFGSIEREFCAGEHVPALQWVKLRGRCGPDDAALLMLNDCKYGHSLDGNVLRVSLIRGTYDPDPQPEIGLHEMAFALQSVAPDYPASAAALAGRAFNHPLRVVGTGSHEGRLPATGALLEVEPANLVVLSVKMPEDPADALILRLNNPDATALAATVKPGAALGRTFRSASETDLLERELPGVTPISAGKDGAVGVSVPAYGLATLRLNLEPPTQ